MNPLSTVRRLVSATRRLFGKKRKAMPRQVILHVGMHKTGTTSIQKSLDGFSSQGVRYVGLTNPNHTGPIAAAFLTEGTQGNRLRAGRSQEQMARVKKQTLTRLRMELSNEDFHTFIISGEGIVFLPPASLLQLRETLLEYVDSVQVFAYVREPVGFSSSAFQQRTKGGDANFRLEQAQYRRKFAPLLEIFGRENVSVKEFSRPALRDGSVVVDFCHLWKIPFDPQREVRSNESVSEAALKLIHLFNRSGPSSTGAPAWAKARRAFIEAISGHFKGRFDLPVKFHGGAIDEEDIAWLGENLGIRFSVDPSIDKSVRPAEFAQFLDDIPPQVVESYRDLLSSLGIPSEPSDSALELLDKHFAVCLEQSTLHAKRKQNSLRRRLTNGVTSLTSQ